MLRRYFGSLLVTVVLGTAQTATDNQSVTFSLNQSNTTLNSQQPNASAKRYPINGSVINALTGAPVARAVVRLQGPEPTQVFTGDDGHFEFKDVLEGGVSVSAQRPGFQNTLHGPQQRITVSASTSSLHLKLMPQSSLRGRVLSNDGEPVEGVSVQVFRRQTVDGMREWIPANGANTDETGTFVVEDLTPGAYLVHTNAHPVFAANSSVVVDGRHFPDLYPAQFYPNAPDRASAQPVQIQPGLESQADFTLTAAPSYTASGAVSSPSPFHASCENAEGELVSNFFRVDRNGQFTLLHLPPGACTLRVRTGSRGADAAYGEMPINIGSADVTSLHLSLDPLPDIPIVISGSGDSSSNSNTNNGNDTGANVQLKPRQLNGSLGFPSPVRKGDGLFFASVLPGTYRVSAQAFGGKCVGSITSGSVDLLRSDLTVSPGGSAAPIEVALRTDCGSISGTVEGPNPADSISLVAVPQAAPAQAKNMRFSGGNIQIPDLTPGDYMIYAAADLSDLPYADPEAMKGLEGQKVTVSPNAKVNIQLQLMSATGSTGSGEAR